MTIFVLDDNELHLKLCKLVLEKKGHNVHTFRSIDEMDSFYDKNKDTAPAIFFIDYRLSGSENGLDALDAVRNKYKWTEAKCVAFTADVSESAALGKQGFDGVLLKPVTEEILTATVGKYFK